MYFEEWHVQFTFSFHDGAPFYFIITIIIQPTVRESCPDGNNTLNSRVELQSLTRVCLDHMDHTGFESFKDSVCMPDM